MSQMNNRMYTNCACGQPDLYLIESFAIRRARSDSSFCQFPVYSRSTDCLIDAHRNGKFSKGTYNLKFYPLGKYVIINELKNQDFENNTVENESSVICQKFNLENMAELNEVENDNVRKKDICTCPIKYLGDFASLDRNFQNRKHTYTCEQNARILKQIEENIALKRNHSAPRNFKVNFQDLCNKIDCKKSIRQNCNNFDQNDRNWNFNDIWNNQDFSKQNRRTSFSNRSSGNASQKSTRTYSVHLNDNRTQNCYYQHPVVYKCPTCFNEVASQRFNVHPNSHEKHNDCFTSRSTSATTYYAHLCYPSGFIKMMKLRNWWMIIIVFLIAMVVALGVPLVLKIDPSSSFEERLEFATRLLNEVPLIDGHNDLPWNIRKFLHNQLKHFHFNSDFRNITPWSTSIWSHTDLPRLKQGLVSAQFWAAYVPCEAQEKDAVQITLEQIDVIRRFTHIYHPPLTFCTSAKDTFQRKEICSLIGVEGGHSISNSLSVLRNYYNLGVRYLTLTSSCNTLWADCSLVDNQLIQETHNGLTEFGKTVIMEMNRLGMIIDLSHVSVKTMNDALAVSKAPVIFSHSSAFSLCNSSRNVPDSVLKKLALNKGIIMINFYSKFLTCQESSTVYDALDHINHVRQVAGIDNVGIGAGFDGINFTPKGLEDVSTYPTLFAELIGTEQWTIEDLKKLAGLNFLRVFKDVEKIRDDFLKASVSPFEDFLMHKSLSNCSTQDLFR